MSAGDQGGGGGSVAVPHAESAKLVEEHLYVVDRVVRELATSWPGHVDRSEMAAAGRLGLVEASRRFDPTRGIPFGHWAKLRVRGAILDAMRDADWAPRGVRTRTKQLDLTREELTARYGRPPTLDELTDEAGLSPDEVHRIDADGARAGVLMLDADAGEGDETSLAKLLLSPATGAEQRVEDLELRALLGGALSSLDDQARTVISGMYLQGRRAVDIGVELGVTESRVSQIHTKTLRILNQMLRERWLGEHSFGESDPDHPDKRSRSYPEAVRRYREWYEEQRHTLLLT